MKKMKKNTFIIIFLAFSFLLTGCDSKPVQYMKYGENHIREISYTLDRKEEGEVYDLMSEGLTIINNKSINLLKNDPKFNAEAIFVSNETKEEAIYSKNCFKKIYPASLTKLMTAYVALVNIKDFKEEIVVTDEAKRINVPFAKLMGLATNDHISLDTLFNAVLVHSSNDAAKTLAYAVAGSEEEFVKLMNQEAINLGAVHTHFSNSHGLHEKSNYTTLYDLYLIFHALLKNEKFIKTIGQKEYIAKYKNGLGGTVKKSLKSTNQYFQETYPVPNGYKIYGGKTGTTDEAGYCMMLYSTSTSGDNYVIGIMKATNQINLYAGFSSIFENIP